MLAPRVARWLLMEFIAVSKVAMAEAATVEVVIEAVLMPKLAVLIDDTTTEMVWPLTEPLWYEKVDVAFMRFMPFQVVWLEILPIWVAKAWNSVLR